jgi:N-acetylornithine carbamoyltransferase
MVGLNHFYNTAELSIKDIYYLLAQTIEMKKGLINKSLYGKTLAMLFFNPSLRTRISFSVAMQKLGGYVLDVPVKEGGSYTFEFEKGAIMNKGTIEHVKEGAGVLSKYCDILAVRASELITTGEDSVDVNSWEEAKKDKIVKSFMEYASVPVINLESNIYHPCQGLADALTIKEKIGNTKKKKYVLTWVYHPKALPMATPNSQILAACDLGMDITVNFPEDWDLDKEIVYVMDRKARESGGSLSFSNDINEGLKSADIVCAKSWGSLKYYGNWEKEKKIREGLKYWIVDKKKMGYTNNAYFMHCLPVRRNVEVTDEIIDGENSLVIEQAENRMWVQMAILQFMLKGKSNI